MGKFVPKALELKVLRIFKKFCFRHRPALWLVRLAPPLLRKTHLADLRGRYAVVGLDVVELRAVYASLPVDFENDGDGAKAAWRTAVRDKLVDAVAREGRGALPPGEARHAAYRALPPGAGIFAPADARDAAASWAPDAADPFATRAPPRRAAAPPGGADLMAALRRRDR